MFGMAELLPFNDKKIGDKCQPYLIAHLTCLPSFFTISKSKAKGKVKGKDGFDKPIQRR
jgi:hypothetical protein